LSLYRQTERPNNSECYGAPERAEKVAAPLGRPEGEASLVAVILGPPLEIWREDGVPGGRPKGGWRNPSGGGCLAAHKKDL
jgi:hypothetical protein